MPTATITSKGQITIPKEVRDELGLHTGDRVNVRIEHGAAILEPKKRDLAELGGVLHRAGMKALSLEQMDDAIGRGASEELLRGRELK